MMFPPNTFIIERYRDTFTPVDCDRATNQVHRPKVKREKIQVPKCIRSIDKTRQDKTGGMQAGAGAGMGCWGVAVGRAECRRDAGGVR